MWRWRLARSRAQVDDDVGPAALHEVPAARDTSGPGIAAASSRRTVRRQSPRHAPRRRRARGRAAGGPARRNHSTSPDEIERVPRRTAADVGRASPSSPSSAAAPERGLVGRRHQHDVAAHDVADRAGQERVVRAAEQQRVDAGVDAAARAAARPARGPGRCRSRPARRTRRSPGTRRRSSFTPACAVGHRRLVGARADRADGADHPDVAVAGGAAPATAPPARSRPTTGTVETRPGARRARRPRRCCTPRPPASRRARRPGAG